MRRKQFRIEHFLPKHAAPPCAPQAAPADAGQVPARSAERAAAELAAAMEAMEKACAFVLGTAERVEERARAFAASAKTDTNRTFACDVQDEMAALYEVCNFQDLAGQRIAKVIRLLTGDEEHPDGHSAPAEASRKLVSGPRLDGAGGHVTQDDVDAFFG